MTKLEQLRQLLKAATPGPLIASREEFSSFAIATAAFAEANSRSLSPALFYVWARCPYGGRDVFLSVAGHGPKADANIALHAAAVNALPALLDVAEAAEKLVTEANEIRQANLAGFQVLPVPMRRLREALAALEAT